jgi:hypothetical protein
MVYAILTYAILTYAILTYATLTYAILTRKNTARPHRLSRALEECDKFKKTLQDATDETKGMGTDYRKDKEKLKSQVRALERQRGELLTAFKKQCKLIEVLKRQKVHTEAAKLLEFTEEEFVKVLDWGN